MKVYDIQNNEITLNATPIASGGEGDIYTISNNNSYCVKLYHDRKRASGSFFELREKIEYMCQEQPSNKILKSLAYPIKAIYDSNNEFFGYMMPFIANAIKIKYLFSNAHRKTYAPHFTQKHYFAVAMNLTLLIKNLHSEGIIVGDLRENNILVYADTKVKIIDTDSFQIKNKMNGKTYFCNVGFEDYLSPEFQAVLKANVSLDKLYNDLFALAVIIFQLLMVYHPYQCGGKIASSTNSRGEKIKNGYFPYANKIQGISIPKNAPNYNHFIPRTLRDLFEKCFIQSHNNPKLRPTADEWYKAIEETYKKLQCCHKDSSHWYISSLVNCPYCGSNSYSSNAQVPPKQNPSSQNNQRTQASPNQQTTTNSFQNTSHNSTPNSTRSTSQNFKPRSNNMSKKAIFVIISIFLMIGLFFYFNSKKNDKQELFSNKILSLSEDIESNPKEIQYYINRAIAFKEIKLYQNSLNDLSIAKHLDKNNMGITIEECEIYTILKEHDIALNKCKKANDYSNHNQVVYYALGLNLFVKKDFKSAITYFQKCIKEEESMIGIYMLALSKEALQKDDEAILLYTQALELKSLEKFSTSLEVFEDEIKNSLSIEKSLEKIKTKISNNAYEK